MTLRLVLATRNRGKARELGRLLQGLPVELDTLDDVAIHDELREDGETFEANARQKLEQVVARCSRACLADDSGLEVDALGGAPGVRSARFAGEPKSDAANNEKLVGLLAEVPEAQRSARFRCVLAFADPGGPLGTERRLFDGVCDGRITLRARGRDGFGYDPHFVPAGHEQTLAEIGGVAKDAISHRGRAVAAFRTWLEAYLRSR